MKLKNNFPPIIFFNDGFDWPLKGNRYYFPYYWSEKTKVLVVGSHQSFKKTLKKTLFLKKQENRTQNRTTDNQLANLKKIKKDLYFFKPKGWVPLGRSLDFNYKLSVHITRFCLKRLIKELGWEKPLLWFFYPEVFEAMTELQNSGTIYHLVDCYWRYPFYYPTNQHQVRAKKLNQQVASQADLVFTSSSYLRETFEGISKNTFLLGNASRTELIIKKLREIKERPTELKNISSPMIGLIGNMTSFRFDFKLLEVLLKEFKKTNFVLIGPSDQKSQLNKLDGNYENCYWLKEKPFNQLPEFLKFFDAAIIPYKRSEHTKGLLPIKLFEYFAAGGPVVSTNLYSLKPFKDLIYLASDKKDFVNKLKKALQENKPQLQKKRVKVASQHSWKNLVEKSAVILSNMLKGAS